MVGHDLRALVRRHGRVPPLFGGGEPLVEVGVPLIEIRLVGGRELRQLVPNRLRDAPAVTRVEPVVRIALRMDVAHRARDLAGRNLENPDVLRRIEVARSAGLDLRVPAARHERRQPPDFELAADRDQHVRAADLENEARLRVHLVRILVTLGERDDGHAIAAHFTRQ